MGFQRAKWHSGLTYRQVCETCKTAFTYTDHKLDFRPWYPDGYVDCPTCGSHMRHNEKYALVTTVEATVVPDKESTAGESFASAFCHNCGTKFGEGHRFCCQCGTKRT